MKWKVFIAIAAAMISAFASVSSAQPKVSLAISQPSKSLLALSEEQVKSLIQSETEKKDALRGKAEAERKFDTTMVWVQVLLGGVSLLLAFVTIVPISLGFLFWIFRKSIFGQLNAEATEEVKKQVEDYLKPTIDTEVQSQISALIEKKLKPLIQEFESAVPASTEVVLSPEKRSRIDKLRSQIKNLLDLVPIQQSAEFYFKEGNSFYFDKQDKESITSYEKAILIEPNYVFAWHNRGRPLLRLNRYEESIASYDKAIEIKPNYAPSYYNKGIVLRKLGRYEEAINSCSEAIKIVPNYVSAWYNRACYYALQEKVEETVRDLKKAIELDSKWREKAKADSDFDKIRHDERFQNLLNVEL